jgi:hypothetical protein
MSETFTGGLGDILSRHQPVYYQFLSPNFNKYSPHLRIGGAMGTPRKLGRKVVSVTISSHT